MVPWLHLLDALVLELMAQGYNELAAIAALAVSLLGNPLTWFVVATYIYWKGNRRKAFHVMLLVMLSSVLAGVLKNYFKKPRPSKNAFTYLPEQLKNASKYFTEYSFPSGHSLIMGSFYGFFRRHISARRELLLFLGLVGVGIARLYLQAHYLTDVLFGMFLGLVLGELVFHLEKRFGEEIHSLDHPHGKIGIIVIIAAFTAAMFLRLPILVMPPFGFFLGHFYSMHVKKHKTEFVWKKETIGFGCLAGIGMAAFYSPSPFQEALFFLAGLWVTLLYPRLYNKFLKKQ